jgi:predicted kinase
MGIRYAQCEVMKRLVVIVGPPGVGKSKLARALSKKLRCPYFDKDFISDAFRTKSPEISKPDSRVTYDAMYNFADGNLAFHEVVVIDAPLVKQIKAGDQPGELQRVAANLGAELKIVRLKCDPETLKKRLEARNLPRDRQKLEDWEAFLEEEPADVPIAADHHDIDSTLSISKQVAKAVNYVYQSKSKAGAPRCKLRVVLAKTYGFKPPLEKGKEGKESFVLWLAATIFFLHRLVSVGQFTKVFVRLRKANPEGHIPPWLAEVIAVAGFAIAAVNAMFLGNGIWIVTVPAAIAIGLCLWRVFDVMMMNLYYLMMRPLVERNPPHNVFRSFLLGALGICEIWVLTGLVWYFVHRTGAPVAADSILRNMYSSIRSDSLISAASAGLTWMALVLMAALWVMVTVVFARAISLLPPLPREEE